MAKFTVEINCDNAAFEDNIMPELSRILGQLSRQYERLNAWQGGFEQKLRDINGNVVGHAEYTEEG